MNDKVLSIKEQNNLEVFLKDLGYEKDNYNQKPILVFSKYLFEDKEKTALNPKGTLENVFKRTNKKLIENLFFQVNTGMEHWVDKPYKHKVEGRKKGDIISYNAFMLDFDLKDENKEHYKGKRLRQEKAKLLRQIWRELPLKPDFIISSRNGFHIYYLIPISERKIDSESWHWLEIGIFNYVQRNISNNVDHAVKKSNQIMRLPYSYHKKDDNNDDGYKVKIIYERNKKIKDMFIEEDYYISAQFAYPIQKLIEAFKVDEDIINDLKSENKNRTSKEIRQTNEYKEKVKNESIKAKNFVTFLYDKYSVTEAISSENANFFTCLQQISPKIPMSRKEATQYIKSFDMRDILGFNNQPLNAAFSSLFYQDTHPSDYFYTNPKTGSTSYYCRLDKYFYNDIFDIVYHLLNFDDDMSEKKKWLKTFNFVYKMFGLNITTNWKQDFEKAILNNLEKFKQIIHYSKHTKYLKCASKLYEELMIVWKEHVYDNNIDWRNVNRTISAKWIGDRINTSRSTIQKELLLLEYVGLINRIDSIYRQSAAWKKDSNEYRFEIINESNINEIIEKVEIIKRIMSKPLKEVTRHKLDILFKKSPS